MENWTPIYKTDKEYNAEMRKNILSENGIEAVVLSHKDSAFKLGEIELMVSDEDVEKANTILKKLD